MAEGHVRRRLSAILAADVVGYSRLIRTDEEGTLARLKALRRELIDPKIAEHGGRIVKLMGDGMLAEFESVVDAVRAAAETQQTVAEHNADLPEDKRIEFRVGINLGDVVIDGDDIYGDGVNIAARLEGLAEPGGICISGAVYDQVRNRTDFVFEDMGEREMKNVDEPIRAWLWAPAGRRVSDIRPIADRPLPLPDKPSIAVLPFDNMTGDPKEEYFSDGISEDIITQLSKISELFVIARTATFTYKGRGVTPKMVARELGVRHVLEGSVRRAGGRVRIAAQLIDGASGAHAWAERYDRTIEDIFDLQDKITTEVTTALQVELTEGEQARLRRRGTRSLTAWDLFLRSQHHFRQFAQVDNRLAREFLDDALNLDPEFSSAWAMKSWTYIEDVRLGWANDANTSIEKGIEAAQRGISANDGESDAYAMMGRLHLLRRQYQKSEDAIKRAIELAPSTADHHVAYGFLLNMTERPSEALAQIELGMRLSPFYPDWYLGFLGMSYRLLGRVREAIATDLKRLERNPHNSYSDVRLAAAYAELGEMEQARHHIDKALRKLPNYRLSNVPQTDPYRDADVMNHYVELLRAAGLPE